MHGFQFDLLVTRTTTKCFSRWRGVTAVHLVSKSFFGLKGFFGVR